MGINGFEGRLERAVEGTFSRLFRTGVSPVEFGRKLVREMDGGRTVGVGGRTIVPNWFRFGLAESDFEQLADLVGRQNDCTIVLGDPNVSRNHAEVRPSGDGFVVADLGSTNGTKVNGVRVAEQQLRDGDEVTFGNTVMHFEAS